MSCDEFGNLKSHNLRLGVNTLMEQVTHAALKTYQSATVYDSPSSPTALDSDKLLNTHLSGAKTVGEWFAQDGSRKGLSQYTGTAIFLNPANWNDGMLFGSPYASSQGASQYGFGTLLHELFPKSIVGGGLTHFQLEDAVRAGRLIHFTTGRNFTSDNLERSCF